METNPEMLDFVKAISSAERLRVIGVLERGPATQAQIAEQLNEKFIRAMDHLIALFDVINFSENGGDYI